MAAEKIGRADWELRADQTGLVRDLAEAEHKIKGAGENAERRFGDMGKHIERGFVVAGAAVGTFAVAGMKMGSTYQDALHTIRSGTGATGEAFAGLEQNFRNVAGRVREDVGTVARVLADLNTRTGLTGQALEDMTEMVLKFSRVTGTDAVGNVALLTRLFGDWSIATEDQAGTMDMLLRASQATGISVDRLMQTVVQFGAPMRALGLSFEESIVLLGKWEKEGVNVETLLSGMRMAVAKFAEAGIDPRVGLPALIEKVRNLDDAQGLLAVKQIVGQRAANDFFRAIKEGRFDIDDLMDVVVNGSETVEQLADDMRTAGDAAQEWKNKITLAIGPLFTEVAGLAEALGPLIYLVPGITAGLGKMTFALVNMGLAAAAAKLAFAGMVVGVPLVVIGGLILMEEKAREAATMVKKLRLELRKLPDDLPQEEVEKLAKGVDLANVSLDALHASGLTRVLGSVGLLREDMHGLSDDLDRLANGRALPILADGYEDFGRRGSGALALLRGAWAEAAQATQAGVNELAALLVDLERLTRERALAIGRAVPGEIGKGMVERSREIITAADHLRWVLENGLTDKDRRLVALGRENVRLFRQGIESGIPGAREATFRLGIESLEGLSSANMDRELNSRRTGQYMAGLYADGWTDQEVLVALAAQGIGREGLRNLARVTGWSDAAIDHALEYTSGMGKKEPAAGRAGRELASAGVAGTKQINYRSAGASAGQAWINGITGSIRDGRFPIQRAAIYATGPIRGFSPPREGPLRDMPKWGANVAEAWTEAFLGKFTGAGRDAAAIISQLAQMMTMPMGASPALAAVGASVGASGPSVSGAGGTVHYHGPTVYVQTGVGDPVAIGRQVVENVQAFERHAGRDWRR